MEQRTLLLRKINVPTLADVPLSAYCVDATTALSSVEYELRTQPTLPGVIVRMPGVRSVSLSRMRLTDMMSQPAVADLYRSRPVSLFLEHCGTLQLRLPLTATIDDAVAECLRRPRQSMCEPIVVTDSDIAIGLAEVCDVLAVHSVELGKMKKAAEQANVAKTQFLANMSHEIRTPMTSILGFASILSDSSLSSSAHEAVETIQRNSEYLLAIIDDILDLSKVESGQATIEKRVFDPIRMIKDVVSLMQVRAEKKGLFIKAKVEKGFPDSIESDPTRLRQILINLVGNAIKFTESGGVTLFANGPQMKGGPLSFDIHDTGIGINADMQERIFHPFVQADETTARRFGGTGLGLSICSRFVSLLGGELSLESEIGQGSVFTLTLPCPIRTTSGKSPNVKKEIRKSLQVDRSCHILLAEDGPDNRKLISHILERAGAQVLTVENGQQAIDAVLSNDFDLVLMDMQMPVKDGYTATRELRSRGVTLPIVALTAHVMDGAKGRCLEAGCDDYSSKPINRGSLIGMINQILAEHPAKAGSNTPSQAIDRDEEASIT